MAYTKQTWADGKAGATPVNAAALNHMEAGIAAAAVLSDLPKAHLYQNTVQNFTSSNWFAVTLDTAMIDSHAGLATGGFKVPTGQAGIYLVDASVYFNAAAAGGTFLATVWVNGAARVGAEAGGSTYFSGTGYAAGVAAGARLLSLNAGDLLQPAAYSTLAAWNTSTNVRTWLTALRVA